MPILPHKKVKRKLIGGGERAEVHEIYGEGIPKGTVARYTRARSLHRLRFDESPKLHYYKNKIARALFPNNFITVTTALQSQHFGQVLLSQKKEFDKPSQALIDHILKEDLFQPENEAKLKNFMESIEYRTHVRKIEYFAEPVAKRMGRAGIYVSTTPVNVWFDKHGNPIFMDIDVIDQNKLLRSFPNKPELKTLVDRALIESETGSAYNPMED